MTKSTRLKADLLNEFNLRPIGKHSQSLQRALNIMRGEPVTGRYVLVILEPYKKWMLGELTGKRGQPVKTHKDKIFTSIEDAERYVFQLRIQRHANKLKELNLTE